MPGTIKTLNAAVNEFFFVTCPSGTRPIGGGISQSGAGTLTGSFPSGGGWALQVWNSTSSTTKVAPYALCATVA